jgi:hypothetical protein
VAAAHQNPLEHWLTLGALEGRDPSAGFDIQTYVDTNADAAAAYNAHNIEAFLDILASDWA